MNFDFEPYFKRYERIVAAANGAFERIKSQHKDCVKCKPSCCDCCFALFDLTFIEALYINHKFNQEIPADQKEKLLESANRADRKVYKIKRQAAKDFNAGKKNEVDILAEMGLERVRCPMLNKKDHCDIYDFRPITCRLYGVPTAIEGMSHTCGRNGFKEGVAYPTVHIEKIHQQLFALSKELVADLKSKYEGMAEMLVPLSMVLLTTYDDEYLGLASEKAASQAQENKADE